MFKTIFAVTLLIPSCVSNIPKNNSVPIRELPHLETLENQTNYNQVFGAYNFYDTYEDSYYWLREEYDDYYETVTLDFYNGVPWFANYINIDNSLYFLKTIDFNIDTGGSDIFLDITFTCYTSTLTEFSRSWILCDDEFGDGYPLVDGTYPSDNYTKNNIILYIGNPVLFDYLGYKLFSTTFTSNDNSYTFTYSGWYNFLTTTTLPTNFNVYGTLVFDSSMYYCLNASTNTSGNNYFDLYYVSTSYKDWLTREVKLPNTSNILFTNCKMSLTSYDRLRTYGVFSYYGDPSDNTTFSELLFTVMDTPVYFLSSLLSFELFGVNMFIAFTGLLTLLMILLLIRKFF